MASELTLTPSKRGFLYEQFREELNKHLKDEYGRQAIGSYQKAIMLEGLSFYFRHMKPGIKETKDFPKKGEPVEKYYIVKIELEIPGLAGRTIEFEKKFLKGVLEAI